MDIQKSSVAEFKTGSVTLTETPQRLPSVNTLAKGVTLKASGTASINGFTLEAGQSIHLPIDDVSKIWVSGTGILSWLAA